MKGIYREDKVRRAKRIKLKLTYTPSKMELEIEGRE
jgi:hypothetical protein